MVARYIVRMNFSRIFDKVGAVIIWWFLLFQASVILSRTLRSHGHTISVGYPFKFFWWQVALSVIGYSFVLQTLNEAEENIVN